MTAMSTERTIGSVAANEALAKIKLYGLEPNRLFAMPIYNEYVLADSTYLSIYRQYFDATATDLPGLGDTDAWADLYAKAHEIIWPEYYYPSVIDVGNQKYSWSALCKRVGVNKVQVTVFVSRLGDGSSFYPYFDRMIGDPVGEWTKTTLPQPVMFAVDYEANIDGSVTELRIDPLVDPTGKDFDYTNIAKYVGKNATIVSDNTGRMFKVMDVDRTTGVTILKFDGNIAGGNDGVKFWVIPPRLSALMVDPAIVPMVGGRYPCVGVYQYTIDY
ncbi:MAG: hypothetical protein KAS23_02590, partial [Anaerohalosphaera sp.]|nr:hypothetical protein [Anaerohalosphaera sp.]